MTSNLGWLTDEPESILVGCWSFQSWQNLRSYQDRVPTCANAHAWRLYSAATLGDQTTSTISHSFTLSWHWANQSLSYPNNAERLDRKREVSIFESLAWLKQGLNPMIYQKQETDNQLIQPSRPDWFPESSKLVGGGEIAQLVRAWSRWPWGQGCESWLLL